jgi:hypothetical protein
LCSPKQIKSGLESIGMSDTFNDRIRSSSIRELLHSFLQALKWSAESRLRMKRHTSAVFLIVPGLGTEFLRKCQSALNSIDGNNNLRFVLEGINQSTQSNGSTTNENNNALTNSILIKSPECIGCSEVSSGEDISHQNQLFLVNTFWGCHSRCVGQRNSHELSLAAIQKWASEEQALLTPGRVSFLAVEALSAGNCEWHHYRVPLLVVLDRRANFHDFASCLVTLFNVSHLVVLG